MQVIAFFAIVAVATAAVAPVPSGQDAQAETLRFESDVLPDSFHYAYETSNNIKGQAAGQLKQIGKESAIVAQGDFSYLSPEGQPIQLSYIADENGYQPTVSSQSYTTISDMFQQIFVITMRILIDLI